MVQMLQKSIKNYFIKNNIDCNIALHSYGNIIILINFQ